MKQLAKHADHAYALMRIMAYFQFHWKFQLGPQFFPVVNNGELAVLYCFVFLFIACQGGVKWSLDKTD